MTTQNKTIHIGCFSGFWGDSPTGAYQLVKQTETLHYLVGDYLAEITMGILARLKSGGSKGMGEGGYVAEFAKTVWEPLIKDIVTKNIKVVTNAGGMNPLALKKHLEAIAAKANVKVTIAAIDGDDIMSEYASLKNKGSVFPFSVEGEIEHVDDENMMMLSCNAYLGAFPIAEALAKGAQVVVTGRTVDSAIVLGPLIHEFGWKPTDLDLLAAGSVTGHIIECGCQATGGNFTDWTLSYARGWSDVGYPIAECSADGTCVITKPLNTGGIVSVSTIAEQIVYEILDPAHYILPDVVVDFRHVVLEALCEDTRETPGRVRVSGARGRSPTPFYKASLTFLSGYRIDAILMIGGIEARNKALATADSILTKTRRLLIKRNLGDYTAVKVEALGSEHTYGPHSRVSGAREVLLRIAVTHPDKQALVLFSTEISPSALAMAPGITGSGAGRPQARPNVIYHSCLIDKSVVPVKIHVGATEELVRTYNVPKIEFTPSEYISIPSTIPLIKKGYLTVPLITLCHGRSGDKGDVANIGIICRSKHYFDHVGQILTSEAVKAYMAHLIKGKVTRYSLPGIRAYNFVCTSSLDGGGMSSLHMDRQGKCYAQMLLDFPIEVPVDWIQQKSKL